ncbi:MAG: nucleotidyl transferase AbiEii/AbiGii toxin family protein [Chloroflexi bacterium]|nr:nucleotidyl transferase AbiEii/AbiGii toxin family protein [Chloroflexota bacterium]
MNHNFFVDRLYPFQDQVLRIITALDTGFYLTGGTAASRGYLNHRFSEDLDFFVNYDDRFEIWVDQIILSLTGYGEWQTEVLAKQESFARLLLKKSDVTLRVEFVKDVPFRVGEVVTHPVLGSLDTAENILANKVTAALDREEPKDLADIWGFCTQMKLSVLEAISAAQGKAAGIFPVDFARVLLSANESDWQLIRWLNPPEPTMFVRSLHEIGEEIIFSAMDKQDFQEGSL